MKALGVGLGAFAFRDVEVVREENTAPRLVFHGEAARRAALQGVARSHVSLTHQPGSAAAVVVLES